MTVVTFPRVLAAEWTKLTSLASTPWIATGTVVAALSLSFGLGLFVRPGGSASGLSLAVSGSLLAQLGILVLGVLVGSGEFSTGTSASTFAAVPRRLPVLAAQVLVTAAVTLVTAAAALAASALVTIGARDAAGLTFDLTDPATARAAAGFVLFLAGVAVCGVGLGALVRRPAAALMTGVVLFVVADHVLATNPGRVTNAVRALLPSSGTRLFEDEAGAWRGGLVLGGWAVAVLVCAAYRLRRHDVT